MRNSRNIILLLLLVPAICGAQHDIKSFTFHGQVFELNLEDSTEKGAVGIPIEIWAGDELITTIESGAKGKYNISLVYYPSYRIKFGRSPFVTKVVEIDAKGFQRAAEFGIVNLDLDVSLFRDRGFLGMDFMNYTPVAIARFNKKKGTIEWDMEYAEQVNGRVRGVLQANRK
jgi:hypothetical protein